MLLNAVLSSLEFRRFEYACCHARERRRIYCGRASEIQSAINLKPLEFPPWRYLPTNYTPFRRKLNRHHRA
jgi:hypothetical protein